MEDKGFQKTRFISPTDRHRRSSRITDETWDLYKPLLCRLYRTYTLQVVMRFMQKRFEFAPTKRQYGYRFEKWRVKKYRSVERHGSARSPPSNEETPYEQIESELATTMPQYLGMMTSRSSPFLGVPDGGRSHRPGSIASSKYAASDQAMSLGDDDTDVEDCFSPPSTPMPQIRYSWGPTEDMMKLIADFCSSVSDEENAFSLYSDLVDSLPDGSCSKAAKAMIATSSARVANQPSNAKRARELLSNSRLTHPSIQSRTFLFSILDAFMEEQEDPERKDASHQRVYRTMRALLVDDTKLRNIPHQFSAIDLVTYSLLSSALGIYEKMPALDGGETPMLSAEDLAYQYVLNQPFADAVRRSEPSVLRLCVNWCVRQLLNRHRIPDEIASIPCQRDQRSWRDDIQLYCTLWHCMLMAVQNDTPPPWYLPCEAALGISPSELLVTVCWVIGAEIEDEEDEEDSDLLQRASTAAGTVSRWEEPRLWIVFLKRFIWLNELVDFGEEDKAFEGVILQHTRRFISATLNTKLPFPADEPTEPSSDWDDFLRCGPWSTMEL